MVQLLCAVKTVNPAWIALDFGTADTGDLDAVAIYAPLYY